MKFTKYEKHGDYHWRQYADKNNKYHHHVNKIVEWVKEKNILDIGAGDGLITFLLEAKGIDNELSGVKIAQEKGVDVELGDAYAMRFRNDQFESATMIDILEHFDDPLKALQEAKRVIRKFLYIVTPPKREDGKLTDKFHVQEWTPEELKTLVESQGFKLIGDIELGNKAMYAKFQKLT